jgi:hypothetical protein
LVYYEFLFLKTLTVHNHHTPTPAAQVRRKPTLYI